MKMWRHRSIPSHMKTLYLLPYLSSSSSTSPSSSTNTIKAIRTLFSLSSNPSSSTLLPPSPHSLSLPQTLILRPTSHPSNFNPRITHGFGVLLAKCVSSISSAHTVDWNEPVTYSEDGDSNSGGVSEEDTKSSIPVRAFFFSTRLVCCCCFLCGN